MVRYKATSPPALKLANVRCRAVHDALRKLLGTTNSRVFVVVKHWARKKPVLGSVGFAAPVAKGDLPIDTMVWNPPARQGLECSDAGVIIITPVAGDAFLNEV